VSKFNTYFYGHGHQNKCKIATNVVVTIAMPTNNFVQEDFINVVPSPTLIKKLDNVNYLIFYNYDNQQD
jgi:hypothetical protein